MSMYHIWTVVLLALLITGGFAFLSCGNPGPINNGTIIGKPSFNARSLLKFKCNKCFQRKGPSSIYCSVWGHWSGDVPKCIPNICPELKLGKGNILQARPFGYEYHFQCEGPTVLIGNPVMVCSCAGRWLSKPPICKVHTPKTNHILSTISPTTKKDGYCSEPEKLINGMMFDIKLGIGEGYQPGDRVYFVCKEPYRLLGPPYRICGANLEWVNFHPYCQKKNMSDSGSPMNIPPEVITAGFCSDIFPPDNGGYRGSNRVGDVRKFYCNTRFKLIGSSFTRCLMNGRWNNRTPTCQHDQDTSTKKPQKQTKIKYICKSHVCQQGRTCKYDPKTRGAVCVCEKRTNCRNNGPFCASDGETYTTKCSMEFAACQRNKNITKISDKPC